MRDATRTRGTWSWAWPGLLGLAAAVACSSARPHVDPRPLVIAAGAESGVYYLLGRALTEVFNAAIPEVRASVLATTGSGYNLRAVEEGTAALAFTQADVGFFAVHEGVAGDLRPYTHLRAMAVLYVNAVQLVTARDSGIQRVEDLPGRRVGVGPPESGTEVAARLVLQAQNLEDLIAAEPLTFDDVADGLARHEVDAAFLVSSYPVPVISRLNAARGVRLVPIERALADRIRADYPFFHPILIPAGTYEGQSAPVETIGVDNLLVCRSDLPDDLVYRLTRVFIESLSSLSRVHAAAASVDPEQAPAAPIALHPGAARFYRERELFR
jgi:TRAP transporter TAXI family solute receptor